MEAALVLPSSRVRSLAEESLCVAAGAVFTLCLFLAMAHFESVRTSQERPQIEDLHAASAPMEPPPPQVEVKPREEDTVSPLTGIDLGASSSSVRIAVLPPDLAKIVPASEVPPRASIQVSQLYTDFRPHSSLSGDLDRIFKQSEVDKVPVAIVKTIARVSRRVRDDADELRTTLQLVIDTNGNVATIEVFKSSGNPEFDAIVLDCVKKEWIFSPAIRKGKNVRCLLQQLVWYKWTGGSPFTL